MTRYSTRALAAALVIGTIGAAAPAIAKDKKDAAANPQGSVTLSEQVRTPLAAAQKALDAGDLATATTQVNAAAAAAKTDDERYMTTVTRFNIELTKQKATPPSGSRADFIAALGGMIDSPRVKQEDVARFLVIRGQYEFEAKQYPQVIQDLSRAKQLGNDDPSITIQLVEAKTKTRDVAGGLADLKAAVDAETAAGRKAPEEWYTFGLNQARTANLQPQLSQWLAMWVNAYPAPSHWHDAIALSGLEQQPQTTADKQRAVDLLRLMRASKVLQDTADYNAYINWAIESGAPAEAKSALIEASNLGKLPTTKLENASTMKRANLAIAALGPMAGLPAKAAAGSAATAISAGDAFYGSGDYAKAAQMYQLAATKGGDVNLAKLRNGEALTMAGDKAGASAAFMSVAPGSPQGPAASIWNAWANRTGA